MSMEDVGSGTTTGSVVRDAFCATCVTHDAGRTTIKAAHRYEVVDIMSRLKIAGARYHFIGAGGVGMSGLARLLIGKKAIVTGSDQVEGAATKRLNGLGAHIHAGHSVDNLDPATDVVVISAAIREDNPELQMARQRGCRVVKYAQFLGELMNHFKGIAVSGTHGKSTTSGWLVYCLRQAGMDANFVVGADILQLGGSSGCGNSDVFVVEACEYDRSFHNFKPAVACILNIDRDHLDCYKDEDAIIESFCQFARGTREDGLIVAGGDDPNVKKMLSRLVEGGKRRSVPAARESVKGDDASTHPRIHASTLPRIVTFGLDPACDFSARNVREVDGFYQFDVLRDGRPLGSTRISLPGLHNVCNALAVVAMAVSIGVEPERLLGAGANEDSPLRSFRGMDRRLMLKGVFPAPGSETAGSGLYSSTKSLGSISLENGSDKALDARLGFEGEKSNSEISPPQSRPDPAFSDPAEGPSSRGITVLDDYGHHPTEIRASLAAIRQRYQPRRLWCVFQAHQYSRTQALLEEFANCFVQADKVIVPEIYFSRDSQASREAVNAKILADRIRRSGTDAEYVATFDAVCDHLEQNVNAGDVVVTMGAGDVWKVADEYIRRLRRDR
ncbi:MAG: UDP-N-acetylmuramate--L-alanine ligase [Phycisphaerales bacterium]